MLLFMIKKSFFDVWDNLLTVALLNAGLLALLAPTFLLARVETVAIAPAAGIGLAALLGFQYLGMAGRFARDMTDYRRPTWSNLWSYWKQGAYAAFVLGLIALIHLLLLVIALPFYTALNSLLGFSALTLLFWISLAWALAAQYYVPLQTRFHNRPLKLIRKCFLLLLDNIGFTIMLAIGALFIALISLLTAFLVPGPFGLLIWVQTGLKLRLLKYDYLEEYPDRRRRTIPWDALLVEERELVGTRTLRGMFFPWKE